MPDASTTSASMHGLNALRAFLLGQLTPVEEAGMRAFLQTHGVPESLMNQLVHDAELRAVVTSIPTDIPALAALRAALLAPISVGNETQDGSAVESVDAPGMARLRALVQPLGKPESKANPAPTTNTAEMLTAEFRAGVVSIAQSIPPGALATTDANLSEFQGILAPAQSADEFGRLGDYRILKLLGKGGMGAVFLAEDVRLDRKVALKVMLPAIAVNPASRLRFLREAKTAAKVEHDYIVPIYQVGEDRGVPFLAMPLLLGEALDERLKKGPLPIPAAIGISRQLAEGLAAAHNAGLIHRDFKPSNVWLERNPDGKFRRARILDFGLARSVREDGDEALTKSGAILGTPAYMAPEQGRGEAVDGRADLFSLGVVMYQTVTGKRPFTGPDVFAILTAIAMDTPPRADRVNPAVPASLADLIAKMMEKSPGARPASGAVVVDTLKRIAAEVAKGPQPASGLSQTAAIAEVPAPPKPVAAPVVATMVAAPAAKPNPFELMTNEPSDSATELVQPVPRVPRNKRGVILGLGLAFALTVGGVTTVVTQFLGGRDRTTTSPNTPQNPAANTATPSPLPPPPSRKEKFVPDDPKLLAPVRSFTILGVILENGEQRMIRHNMPLPSEPFIVDAVEIDQSVKPPAGFADSLLNLYPKLPHLTDIFDGMGTLQLPPERFTELVTQHPNRANFRRITGGFQVSESSFNELVKMRKLTRLCVDARFLNESLALRLPELTPTIQVLGLWDMDKLSQPLSQKAKAAIAAMPVEELQLSRSPIVDAAMLRELAKSKTLKNLGLFWAGKRVLAPELSQLKSLTVLSVEGWGLTDNDGNVFAPLTNLRRLNMWGNPITKAGVDRLATLLPNCEIVWSGGTVRYQPSASSPTVIRGLFQGWYFRERKWDGGIALSPDGTSLAYTSIGDVRIISAQTGMFERRFSTKNQLILRLAMGPNGLLLSAGQGGNRMLWDYRNGQLLHELPHGENVYAVAIRPDGLRVATAGGQRIKIWDVKTGQLTETLELGTNLGFTQGLAYFPSGALLASASQDGHIRLWKPESSLKPVASHGGYTDGLCEIAVSPNEKYVAVVEAGAPQSRTGKLIVLDAKTWQPLFTRTPVVGQRVAFAPDSASIWVSPWDAPKHPPTSVRQFDITGKPLVWYEYPEITEDCGTALSPDGTMMFLAVSRVGMVTIDLATGKPLMAPKTPPPASTPVVIPKFRNEREVAEWVISLGGSVWVAKRGAGGGYRDLKQYRRIEDLPPMSPEFWLQSCILNYNPKVTDDVVQAILKSSNPSHIELAGTNITDAALKLPDHPVNLSILDLQGTKITRKGIENILKASKMYMLRLDGVTTLHEDDLLILDQLPLFKKLYLTNSSITPNGIAKIQRQMPSLDIITSNDLKPKPPQK